MAQKQVTPLAQPVRTAASQKKESNHTPAQMVFGKANYQLLFVSIAVIILGFALMSGTTDIYEARKIIVAPLVVLTGFGIGFWAIFKKTESK
ncbi:DUF3098 domain-containing protein [Mucilaginibacter sp. HMF5004]|uniref:DUF3098 domain-containing protein n=1 Tax=Mucilaginibacter rivuli TaxID=2857527 RepID=UPI001C5F128A|nr:DUF3098 domain-containing protein [Mucilaginibacter rivuli]MBW4888871.1 DUF3098 domain-containing protein [Mucilaginibacter rivuli]